MQICFFWSEHTFSGRLKMTENKEDEWQVSRPKTQGQLDSERKE